MMEVQVLGGGRKRLCSSLEAENQPEQPRDGLKHPVRRSTAEDCTAWLLRNNLSSLVAATQQQPPLGTNFWWAVAELNVTLSAFQHLFTDCQLLESHSFARCPKSLAFEKLAFARGCRDVWSLQQQPHLQAVSLLLETALQGCNEAAISQITLRCPPFLASWAARQPSGSSPGGAPPRLRLMVMQGYHAQAGPLRATHCYNLGMKTITSAAPHATVYLPCP